MFQDLRALHLALVDHLFVVLLRIAVLRQKPVSAFQTGLFWRSDMSCDCRSAMLRAKLDSTTCIAWEAQRVRKVLAGLQQANHAGLKLQQPISEKNCYPLCMARHLCLGQLELELLSLTRSYFLLPKSAPHGMEHKKTCRTMRQRFGLR